ncbi:MAG: hypothetical protein JOY68_11195 [Candidatus Dormibacteraeota bacterium]|nr:hypothetical protein [Candidatus Dormibacteraeota bacterium]
MRALLPVFVVAIVGAAAAFAVSGHPHAGSTPSRAALVAAVPTPMDDGGCSPRLLSLTGSVHDCVDGLSAESCTQRSTFEAINLLHGTGNAYLLYIEVDGGYAGPATFRLAPWPHQALDVGDGAPKVALRLFGSGRLYESYAGRLTIDVGGWSGTVTATLRYSGTASPAPADVTLAGSWTCLP